MFMRYCGGGVGHVFQIVGASGNGESEESEGVQPIQGTTAVDVGGDASAGNQDLEDAEIEMEVDDEEFRDEPEDEDDEGRGEVEVGLIDGHESDEEEDNSGDDYEDISGDEDEDDVVTAFRF